MLSKIHELIHSRLYEDAVRLLNVSEISFTTKKTLLEYCSFKLKKHQSGDVVDCSDSLLYFVSENKSGKSFQTQVLPPIEYIRKSSFFSASKHIVLLFQSKPTLLEFLQLNEVQFYSNCTYIQICDASNFEASRTTCMWLAKLGLKVGAVREPDIREEWSLRFFIEKIDSEYSEALENALCFGSNLGLSRSEMLKDAERKVKDLSIKYLDHDSIISKIRSNLGYYRLHGEKLLANEGLKTYPDYMCEFYLKNKYYNSVGVYEKDWSLVRAYFKDKAIYPNFYAEKIDTDFKLFEKNPEEFLSEKGCLIFLDPTCYDQRSGISTYLQNLYKFFLMSRLGKRLLFFKNPYSSQDSRNRERYRILVAETFNKFSVLSRNLLFIDSEAHYPGFLLDRSFRKLCVVHCSSVLASKLDGKLGERQISKGLLNILTNEIANIKSADFVLTPTRHHDHVQQSFYSEHVQCYENYTSTFEVNYIHDDYIKYRPFAQRTYDLVFLGRPQAMKGIDVLVGVAEKNANLKFAIVTNGLNEFTEKLSACKNVKVFINQPRDAINNILSESRAFIDLSPHHSCSMVLLEAINAKTPGVLRDIKTYHEILQDKELKDLYCFLNAEEIADPMLGGSKIAQYIERLSSISGHADVDRLFNKFLLNNYLSTYSYYKRVFDELGFEKVSYNYSSAFGKYVEKKKIICVVHSNSISADDGRIIDEFDVVVRFNRAIENAEPRKHGSRTDVLYSCMNRSPDSGNMTVDVYRNHIQPSRAWVVKAFPSLRWQGTYSFDKDLQAGASYDSHAFECFNDTPLKTSSLDLQWYKIIEANITSRPNTGVLAFLDLLQYAPKIIFLKGYTFFKGGYDFSYRAQTEEEVLAYMNSTGYHNQYRQNLFIRKILMTEEELVYDAGLAEVLSDM